MKVLLIDPPWTFLEPNDQTRQVQPLGLAYIGAAVVPHHDLAFLLPDTQICTGDDPWREIESAIVAVAPDLIGISSVTATYPNAVELARRCKAIGEATIVLGGVHASINPTACLSGGAPFDFVVHGEGEETFAELLALLESEKTSDSELANVSGIAWRDGDNKVRMNPSRALLSELDSLAPPLREPLVWSDHIGSSFYQAMITGRGCPYTCIYCMVPNYSSRRVRYHSAERVISEIDDLCDRYHIPYLFFHDSVFTLSRKRSKRLCHLLLYQRGALPFTCQTRTDRVDAEILDALAEAGCSQIMYGIESGDPQSLQLMKKQNDLASVRRAVQLSKERGLSVTGFFMIGFPWETEEQMQRTADFACELELDSTFLFSVTALPGTELWEMCGSKNAPFGVDFRTPAVNLSRMSDVEYQQIYERISAQIQTHNMARMVKRAGLTDVVTWPSYPGSLDLEKGQE